MTAEFEDKMEKEGNVWRPRWTRKGIIVKVYIALALQNIIVGRPAFSGSVVTEVFWLPAGLQGAKTMSF